MDKEDNKPGIGGKAFQLKIPNGTWVGNVIDTKLNLQVITDPVPYRKENKSKWILINKWRKLIGTYWESGYKYTVKVIDK